MSARPLFSSVGRQLRVLHATDIHFLLPPTAAEVLSAPKRLVGCTNLYALGRAKRFSLRVQQQLVRAVLQHAPDVLVLSGDLTCLATEREFALARRELHPLLDNNFAFPTLILPGNHDAYTRAATGSQSPDAGLAPQLMRRFFGPWMQRTEMEQVEAWQWKLSAQPKRFRAQIERQQEHFLRFPQSAVTAEAPAASATPASGAASITATVATAPASALPTLPVFAMDFLRFLCLNPCRPTSLGSNGRYAAPQLAQLHSLLRDVPRPVAGQVIAPWRAQPAALGSGKPVDATAAEAAARSTGASDASLAQTYNVLLGHYPILDGNGHPYEEAHKWHGVSNGAELRSLLQRADELRALPHMFLHGHVHKGYQDQMAMPEPLHTQRRALAAGEPAPGDAQQDVAAADTSRRLLSFNPGSSGQSFDAEESRAAAFNLYTIGQSPVHGPLPEEPLRAGRAGQKHFTHCKSDDARIHAGKGGVQTIYQPSADGAVRYFVRPERWVHDGTDFIREHFPYTSGF